MEVVTEEYGSRIYREGKRGRPRLEPHNTLTLRMGTKKHTAMIDYCVEHDISQREFTEQAGQRLLENPQASALLLRRRRTLRAGQPLEPTSIHTLRMNRRLKKSLVAFCLDRDVSQRDFIELGVELLVRDTAFSQRVKARRTLFLQQRAAYHLAK